LDGTKRREKDTITGNRAGEKLDDGTTGFMGVGFLLRRGKGKNNAGTEKLKLEEGGGGVHPRN